MVDVIYDYGLPEDQAISEADRDGFATHVMCLSPNRTEPHRHDYDVRLYILEGTFELSSLEDDVVHMCGPGAKVFVGAGTLHAEQHDGVKLVVGRRTAL